MSQPPDDFRPAGSAHTERVPDQGVLLYAGTRRALYGRTLRLVLWLAEHQSRLNSLASGAGQLWLTWKGDSPSSIQGDFRTPL